MTDYRRHLKSNMKGEFEEIEKTKSKSKPREIVMSEQMTNYLIERDRCLWREGKSIDEIKIKYNL